MSALLIDELSQVEAPAARQSRPWVHIAPESRTAPVRQLPPTQPHPASVRVPSALPKPAAPRPSTGELHLTRRGLALVMGVFAALMVTAVVVLVSSFLSVSNDPVDAPQAAATTLIG